MELKDQVYKNTERIVTVEKENAVQNNKIDNLCTKIDKLVDNNNKWFYFAITTVVAVMMFLLKESLF